MSAIESYTTKEEGYSPFLISDGWQVAQLNFIKEQHIDSIDKIEVHHQTDEAFILLRGEAVLISVNIIKDRFTFITKIMKPHVTYNIPKGIWHNIAMENECELLIVEKSNTHINDVTYKQLDKSQIMDLRYKVGKLLKENIDYGIMEK